MTVRLHRELLTTRFLESGDYDGLHPGNVTMEVARALEKHTPGHCLKVFRMSQQKVDQIFPELAKLAEEAVEAGQSADQVVKGKPFKQAVKRARRR